MSLDANQVYQGCRVLALPFEPYHGFLQERFAFKDGCFSSSSSALHGVCPSYPSSSSSYTVFVFRVVSAVMLIMHELLENSISDHLCSFFLFSFVLFSLQMSNLYTTQTQRSGIRTRTRRKLNDSQQGVVTQKSSSSPVSSSSSSSSSSVPSAGLGWCGLCGDGGGWMSCGRCMGEGGFSTRSGLAGIKGKVGWARCKLCYGHKFLPCLLCGISKSKDWKDCKAPLPPCSENKNLQ